MQEDVTVKIEGADKELVIRTGKALELRDNPILTIGEATIGAPATYAAGRDIDPKKALVLYGRGRDGRRPFIKLIESQNDPMSSTIVGQLVGSPDLALFNLNGTSRFTRKELFNLLRRNRRFFADRSEHEVLLKLIADWKMKSSVDVRDGSDNRGSVEKLFSRATEHNLPEGFDLEMPIFVGEMPQKFHVELCMEVNNDSATFWLECPDFYSLVDSHTASILLRELNNPSLVALPIIEIP